MQPDFERLIATVAQQTSFSGAIRITTSDQVVASAAFGYADRSAGVDNTPDTRLAIASGTKLLTALGIGVLIDESRLTLDTQLHDVVSFDLSGVAREVTIGQLLTHTSGVYDYYDEELIDDFDAFTLSIAPHQLQCPLDYLPMVVGGEMKFAPGERFSYSNSGYVLLGILLQELCGDYHRFIESRVMQRAGMDSSGFFRFDQLPDRTAHGYITTASGWRTNTDTLPIIGGPDGGAFVTTQDMQRLWRALFAAEILSPALTRVFLRKAVRSSDTVFYGHGLWIRDDGSQPPVIYIEGADAGVSFHSSCHGDSVVATVVGNSSSDASPMVGAVDDFVRREFPAEARLFSFEL